MMGLWTLAQDEPKTVWDILTGMFPGHWGNYALAFGVILVAFALRKFIADVVLAALSRLSKGTQTKFDDMVLEAFKTPMTVAILVAGIWAASLVLQIKIAPTESAMSPKVAALMTRLVAVFWIMTFGWVGLNLCDVFGKAIENFTAKTETKLDDMLVPIVKRSMKLFVVLIVFILIVQNLGYSIGALLAGFSVGGVAVALASQDTLQNLFGSVMIFVDRPFQVGDWIACGSIEGVVEEVGMRSTRVRTFKKTLITVPNSKIAHEAINNYSRMPKRRVKESIGIGYTTEPDRVEAVVHAFRGVLAEDERVDQDFWMVNFDQFGDSALTILVYYFTKSTAYTDYMQTRQDLNLKFMRILETMGVEIAFPTRTVYMRQDADPEMPPLEEVLEIVNASVGAPPAPTDADDGDDGD